MRWETGSELTCCSSLLHEAGAPKKGNYWILQTEHDIFSEYTCSINADRGVPFGQDRTSEDQDWQTFTSLEGLPFNPDGSQTFTLRFQGVPERSVFTIV